MCCHLWALQVECVERPVHINTDLIRGGSFIAREERYRRRRKTLNGSQGGLWWESFWKRPHWGCVFSAVTQQGIPSVTVLLNVVVILSTTKYCKHPCSLCTLSGLGIIYVAGLYSVLFRWNDDQLFNCEIEMIDYFIFYFISLQVLTFYGYIFYSYVLFLLFCCVSSSCHTITLSSSILLFMINNCFPINHYRWDKWWGLVGLIAIKS